MKEFRYIVTVTADTQAEADQVAAERIGYEEDYGFVYQIDYATDPQ